MKVTINGIEVRPTVNKIVVRLHKHEKITPSGILIPATVNKETDYYGEVMAVSRTESDLKVGDNVVVRKHTGVTIEVDQTDSKYKMYTKNEVLYVC